MALWVVCRTCNNAFHPCRDCGQPQHAIEHALPNRWPPGPITLYGEVIMIPRPEHHPFVDGAGHEFDA